MAAPTTLMILRGIVASSLVGKSDPGYNGGDRDRPKRLKQNSSIGHADIDEELEMIFGSKKLSHHVCHAYFACWV